jgi:hypothetical protein
MTRRIPIFCQNCELLALAWFDRHPLCENCLFELLDNTPDSTAFNRIRPLEVLTPPKKPSAHSDDTDHRC